MDIKKIKKNPKNNFTPRDVVFGDKDKRDVGLAGHRCQVYRFGQTFDIDEGSFLVEERYVLETNSYQNKTKIEEDQIIKLSKVQKIKADKLNKSIPAKGSRRWVFLFLFFVLAGGAFYIKNGLDTKKQVLGVSKEAYSNVSLAIESAKRQDFALSADKFGDAHKSFSQMSESLGSLGKGVIDISRFVPGASKLSSGYYLVEAGKNLSQAGEKISQVANNINEIKERAARGDENSVSILEVFKTLENDLSEINGYLLNAQSNLDKVKIEDIPEENQAEIIELKSKLPIINDMVKNFFDNSHIMADFLGANGSRKYLFLFQNNQEMRPTGGFIGSYGVLDIDGTGRIRKFFIDGIFNPDGQLLDKIVPPKPIQKVSVAWSMHDSNWFADFPTSAQKAMLFYEKTGGPTVDGVITLTPTVMQKLLAITGPIEMPDYGVTLTQDNFIENIQYEVEVDYDKEENRPKKILSDLAPMILDRLSQDKGAKNILSTMDVVGEALKEKHVLLYFTNQELQKIISDLGWSGEILKAEDDYLSVINTNINGFKTDGIVEEKINHQINIHSNGEIIDTVTINRKHLGGDTPYEWWNKVNANYVRVYVPNGSELLEVEGQTREINDDVVDYQSLNFERDADVEREEKEMKIDSKTGTRVYTEGGKTVFANWVYVSPKEEVNLKYRYKLPFKFSGDIRSYSLLTQKQSGSLGSGFDLTINYPKNWKEEWKSDELGECDLQDENFNQFCFSDKLKTDKFIGSVFVDK